MKSCSCISSTMSPQAHSTAGAGTDLVFFSVLFFLLYSLSIFPPFLFLPSLLRASTAGPCPPNPSMPRTAQTMPILPSTTGTPGRFKGKAPELQHGGQELHNSRSLGLGSLHSFWTQPKHPIMLLGVKCCCSFPHRFQLFYRRGGFKSCFSLTCSLLFKVWLCGHSSSINSSLHINIYIYTYTLYR